MRKSQKHSNIRENPRLKESTSTSMPSLQGLRRDLVIYKMS